MAKLSAVNDFLHQRQLAVVGVSHTGKKMGNAVYNELKQKGYELFPVHPKLESLSGERCYPNLKSLPKKVDGVFICTKPTETENIVREAQTLGIKHIWIQQGAESDEAISFCKDNNINLIHGECILMFAEPTAFFHRLHRGVWKIIGKFPK